MTTIRQGIGALLRRSAPLGSRTFDRVRFDIECALQRIRNFCSPSYRRTVGQLGQRNRLSINVGSGGYGRSDWINVDARSSHADSTFAHDIRRPIPLNSGCARRIFAEHVVEHLDFRHELPRVLADFYRLLEPGGTLRVVVPDAGRFLEAYVHGDWSRWEALGWSRDRWPADILTPMQAINHIFHQEGEHFFGYDWQTLETALRNAKFQTVRQMSFGESLDADLALDREVHRPYSLYVDAVK